MTRPLGGGVDDDVRRVVLWSFAAVTVLVAVLLLLIWPSLSELAWKTLLFAIALVLNLLLCAAQVVTLINLWEYSQDHLNHYDVEKSMRRLIMPEQLLQLQLALVHCINQSWTHSALQVPVAVWHAYNLALGRAPVQAVLGREDKLQEQLSHVRKAHMLKAVFYVATLVCCAMTLMPLSVKLIMTTDVVQRLMNHHAGGGLHAPHLAPHLARVGGSHQAVAKALFGAFNAAAGKKAAKEKEGVGRVDIAADIGEGAGKETK